MAGVEEAAPCGIPLNGDLDPDDREEGAASAAEEAAKKKDGRRRRVKGLPQGNRNLIKKQEPQLMRWQDSWKNKHWKRMKEMMTMKMEMVMEMEQLERRRREDQKFKHTVPQFQYVTCILMVYFPKDKKANTHPHKMGEQLLGELQVKKRKH